MAVYIEYKGTSIRWFPNASGDGRADIKVDGGFVSFPKLGDAYAWIDAGKHVGDMTIHPM